MSTSYAKHFSLASIPYGVASCAHHPHRAIATRLEDTVDFLYVLVDQGHLSQLSKETRSALKQSIVDDFAALPKSEHLKTRTALHSLLQNLSKLPPDCTIPITQKIMHLPVHINEFTDFSNYTDNILNAGEAVLGVRKLPPAFSHFPIGYSGCASSIFVSGMEILRPLGMYRDSTGQGAVFGPRQLLDYEPETACIIRRPSQLGVPLSVRDAEVHIFGSVLLNDWSARDILAYEMHPLSSQRQNLELNLIMAVNSQLRSVYLIVS